MFFGSWEGLLRILIVGLFAYVGLVALLRVSGKRTLAKMNAFDLVVTVALGSTLATVILSKDVALAEGLLAMALLIALQLSVTWLSVRSATVRGLARGEPTLLLFQGRFLHAALKSQRTTESEIRQALRSQGVGDLSDRSVVLETDGSFSVLKLSKAGESSSLKDVPMNTVEVALEK